MSEPIRPRSGLKPPFSDACSGVLCGTCRVLYLTFNPAGWAILAVGCVAYLALPRAMFGAHLADQRLPIAIAFMLVACFEVDLRDRAIRHGFMVLVAVLLVVRVAEVQLVWNHLDRGTKEFFRVGREDQAGARVLVVYGDRIAVRAFC